jgi:DNA-directed RNA polymerase subunit RPC12/RpoP
MVRKDIASVSSSSLKENLTGGIAVKLRISKRSRFFAALLYYGGITLLIGSIPIAAVAPELVPVVMIAGAMAGFAGALWINRLYRCPQCGKELLGRNWESFTMTPYHHCPNCGWTVEIEFCDKR